MSTPKRPLEKLWTAHVAAPFPSTQRRSYLHQLDLPQPGEPSAQADAPDAEKLAARLLDIRHRARERLPELAETFAAEIERRGAVCARAATQADAAAYLARLAQGHARVMMSNSQGVKELLHHLARRGVNPQNAYLNLPQVAELDRRWEYFWQQPASDAAGLWHAFTTSVEVPLLEAHGAARRDFLGIATATAAGAREGSLAFVQHQFNLSDLLEQARTLAVLVPLERLVGDGDEAAFQAQCAGFFGLESVVLGLQGLQDRQGRTGGGGEATEPPPLIGRDGEPRQVHVILLDDGRSTLAGGPYDDLLLCIGCRACLRRCPTYRSFRGGDNLSPRDYLWRNLGARGHTPELCLSCGNCKNLCPVGVDVPLMLARAKEEHGRHVGFGRSHLLLGHSMLLAPLAGRAAPLSNAVTASRAGRWLLGHLGDIDTSKPMPAYASPPLARRLRERPAAEGEDRERVAYFSDGFAAYHNPSLGQKTVAILEWAGARVEYPPQEASAIPLISHGLLHRAARVAQRNVLGLDRPQTVGGRALPPIICSEPSASYCLATEYPALLGTAAAARVAARTRDLFTYLLARHRLGLLPQLPQTGDERIIRYHRPCHIRTMNIGAPAVEFLGLLGFAVEEIDRGCCGLAGSFGYGRGESGHDLSMAIGQPLFQALREARAELCVTECSTCRMQIEQGWGGVTAHPLELVWELIQAAAPEA